MLRTVLLSVLLLIGFLPVAAASEDPPYSPAIDASQMAVFTDAELGFSVRYPMEFKAEAPQNLFAVMRAGHQELFGTSPDNDPEHQQAERCMRPLLYATSTTILPAEGKAPVPLAGEDVDGSPDSVMVMDVERSCIAKKLKSDKALTQLTGTVLNIPGLKQVVPQMWFQGGDGRHIHSGMAAGVVTPPHQTKDPDRGTRKVLFAIAAASFEQKGHWILVAYLNGTRPDMHNAFSYTSVSFEGGRDVLLFPFLTGKYNMAQ